MSGRHRDSTIRFFILLAGLATFVFFTVFLLTSLFGKGGRSPVVLSGDRIGVLEIKGVILDSKRILDNLKTFVKDKNVKGIILRIDSPGGAVAPSQEIYAELMKIHEKGDKKIVASFGNVAASGGYYIAAAADQIVTNPGSITGSIGVIMELTNIQDLLEKVGVESYVVKSGEFKDIGNITRPMSPRERQVIQSVIDDVYMQFVEDVAKGRGIDVEKVKQIANGSVFSGRQALGLGLVDKIGTFEDAIKVAADLAGIEGEPKLIYEKKDRMPWIDYIAQGVIRQVFESKIERTASHIYYLMQ
jgi:protease-4